MTRWSAHPAALVPIGRLVTTSAVGTKVHDAHGVTTVVATKANGVKDVLRLHTAGRLALDVTPDHLVWRATDLVIGEFTVAGFLRPGDYLLHVAPDVGGSGPQPDPGPQDRAARRDGGLRHPDRERRVPVRRACGCTTASSWPSTTRWTRSWSGTGKKA